MKIKVQVVIETVNEGSCATTQIACFERDELTAATLGLTLAESKQLVAALQETVVALQVEKYLQCQQDCPHCGAVLVRKGKQPIMMRTLFGTLALDSPRFYTCDCQPAQKQSFSPLAERLPQRSTPELLYMQSKWAALMSYGLTIDLLSDILPVQISETSLRRQVNHLAERYEQELGDDQPTFIEGCPRQWEDLPIPTAPLPLGLERGDL